MNTLAIFIAWLVVVGCVATCVALYRARRRTTAARANVSLGYTATWVPSKGQGEGETYDFEQRAVRADHVYDVERALVEARPHMNAPHADEDACARVFRAVNARVHPRVKVSPEASVSSSSWVKLPKR